RGRRQIADHQLGAAGDQLGRTGPIPHERAELPTLVRESASDVRTEESRPPRQESGLHRMTGPQGRLFLNAFAVLVRVAWAGRLFAPIHLRRRCGAAWDSLRKGMPIFTGKRARGRGRPRREERPESIPGPGAWGLL